MRIQRDVHTSYVIVDYAIAPMPAMIFSSEDMPSLREGYSAIRRTTGAN